MRSWRGWAHPPEPSRPNPESASRRQDRLALDRHFDAGFRLPGEVRVRDAEVLVRDLVDALLPSLGGHIDHAATHGVVTEQVVRVDDVHCYPRIAPEVSRLLMTVDDVD